MFLFPEEQTIYSRDNTLDPAYFAKKPKIGNSSGGGGSSEEIEALTQTIRILQQKIIVLENKRVHVSLTQEQYDALSESEKMADVEYFII